MTIEVIHNLKWARVLFLWNADKVTQNIAFQASVLNAV